VKRIASDIRDAVSQGASHDEIEHAISCRLLNEAGEELIATRRGGSASIASAAFDLVSNFIPLLSALSFGRTVGEITEARSSWVALLRK
jgi:hypothetical protein